MAVENESQQEYISDRAIEKTDEDLFRHGDIVTELAELAINGPAKTNIALFAPWGTGKSGIAKLLRPKIEAENRFAYFDSFKHRETPLRRSFLRAIAKELGEEPDEFDQFYKQKVSRRLKEGSHWSLLGYVAKALAVGLVLMLAVSLLLAWPRTEPKDKTYWDSVIAIFTGLGGLAAFIAAFVGIVVTSVAQGLAVEETTAPLSDDDEFESAFEDLAAGEGRLIVFIDELDRCSAGEVVETLETLRVFLDVEDCVFVVAADRQALEQALRHRARQETPADETHPYFSSGGSYIDKIFQCQLSLPPVRPRDMTGFAQTLLKDRGGCWQELRDRGELSDVIGALIPTHLRSARQVKVLLNAYVVAHRIAAQRETAGEIAPLAGRAAALAQLVCLRTEFPSFAEQLGDYPQLGRALLTRDRNSSDPLAAEIPNTWRRAGEFLELQLPIAPLLITPKKVHHPQHVSPSTTPPEQTSDQPEQVAGDQSPPPLPTPTDEFTNSEAWRIAKRQLDDLLAYFARVKTLPQIDRDLIYLHSAAAAQTTLEPELADRLDVAARNGRTADLDALLGDLDQERGSEAIEVLLGSLAEANLDVERTNASRVLLAACSRVDLSNQIGDRVAVALGQASGDGGFEKDLVPEAIALAAKCSQGPQGWILSTISAGSINLTDSHALLEVAELIPNSHSLLERAVALALKNEDEVSLSLVTKLPDDLQRRITLAGGRRFKGQIDKNKDQAEAEANPDDPDPSEKRAEALDASFAFFTAEAPAAALALAIAMTKLGERPAATRLRERLESLAPIRDRELVSACLELAQGDLLPQRRKWLSPLDQEGLSEASGTLIDSIAATSFGDTLRPAPELDQSFQALLPELERLRSSDEHPTDQTERVVTENVCSPVAEAEVANIRARASANAELLARTGLLRRAAVADAFIQGATASLESLESSGPEHIGYDATVRGALETARSWSKDAGEVALRALLAAALRRPEAEPVRGELTIAVAEALRALDLEIDPPVEVEDLLLLADSHGDAAIPALFAWVQAFALDASQLWAALQKFWPAKVPGPLGAATASRAKALGGSVQADLAKLAITYVIDLNGAGAPENWDAVGLRSGSSDPVMQELTARAEGNLSAEQWLRLLEICRQLVACHPQTRAALAKGVLLPLARTDFTLAVNHLGLASANDRELIEEMRIIAENEDEERLLGEKIKELGWGKGALESLVSKLFSSKPKSKPAPRDSESEKDPGQGTDNDQDIPKSEEPSGSGP